MNLRNIIHKVINEEFKLPEKVRRMSFIIDSGLDYLISKFYKPEKICDLYASYDEFIQVVSDAISERIYYHHFSHLDDAGKEWGEIYNGIMSYVDDHWGGRLEEYFNENCNKQSINEDVSDRVRDKFYSFLKDNSLMTAISFFGHDKVSEILNEVDISKEDRIKFIKEVINEYGPLSIFDLNEDPIFYSKNDTEYREIYYFGKNRVSIKVWDLDWNELGDFDKNYESLDDTSIYDIFEMLYEYHEEQNKETLNESIEKKKIPQTAQKLIKELPDELKKIFFNQWKAKQNPEWHPEGNTLKHIIVVIKRAFHHYPDDPNMIMAALFHDLGKMDTYAINPKTNQPTAYGHENKSTDYVEMFKDWIESFEGTDVDEVKYLVKNHMLVKPRTWDSMKDKKKEPIQTHKSFDKLKRFTDKLDGGGTSLNESSKKHGVIKTLINNAVEELKHICETENNEDDEYVYRGVCELIDSGMKIQVNNISEVQGKIYIELIVNYKNYHHFNDEEPLEWEIQTQLRKWIPNCLIVITEMINDYPEDQRQW